MLSIEEIVGIDNKIGLIGEPTLNALELDFINQIGATAATEESQWIVGHNVLRNRFKRDLLSQELMNRYEKMAAENGVTLNHAQTGKQTVRPVFAFGAF